MPFLSWFLVREFTQIDIKPSLEETVNKIKPNVNNRKGLIFHHEATSLDVIVVEHCHLNRG